MGPGCPKTRGRSIKVEQVNRSRPFRGARIAIQFNFEVELQYIILVALQDFEFSHSLGQKRPSNWLMIKPHDDQELLRLPAYLRALRRQARI
jgi:hypothetical protein